MILNISGRTDIVHYYTPWLMERLKEGYVLVRNPYNPEQISRYELSPSKVDCLCFCSKNYEPLLEHVKKITEKFNAIFFYTITAYGKDMESDVPSADQSIDTLLKLEKLVGKDKIFWRYDPVLLTKKYTIKQHLITFEHMAARLQGHVAKCIFSFVEMYGKVKFNMKDIQILTAEEMEELAEGLGRIAKKYSIELQTCETYQDFTRFGIKKSGCVNLSEIGKIFNIEFKDLTHRGTRKGCHCIKYSDMGAYSSCPAGCRYCYATDNTELALKNYKVHDPHSPMLFGKPLPTDKIVPAKQKSFLREKNFQLELF